MGNVVFSWTAHDVFIRRLAAIGLLAYQLFRNSVTIENEDFQKILSPA
jgi:hypothetical protein